MYRAILRTSLMAIIAITLSPLVAAEMVNGEDLSDPTRPLMTASASANSSLSNQASRAGSLRVESILIRNSTRMAVINSQRVEVGDRVGGARIISIAADRVSVEQNGEQQELPLYQNSIKMFSGSEG